MNNSQNIIDAQQTFYAIRVNNIIISSPRTSQHLAEEQIKHLSEDQQAIAEVVPVTNTGQQILLG